MNTKLINSTVLIALILAACNNNVENPVVLPENADGTVFTLQNNDGIINNNMVIVDSTVTFERYDAYDPTQIESKASHNTIRTKLVHKYEYVANVEPVTQNGVKLSASHMVIDGTYAYVTYNTYGNRYGGAVQIIDLVDASKPKIVSQLLFPESDINAITIDRTLAQPKAWLAASTNKNGAEIYEVALSSTSMLTNQIKINKLTKVVPGKPSVASANSIETSDGLIYVTAGSTNGLLVAFDKNSFVYQWSQPLVEAKYVTANSKATGAYVSALTTGDQSYLYYGKSGETKLASRYPLGQIIHQNVATPYDGKATATMLPNDNICWISKGKYGLAGFNLESQTVQYTSPNSMLTQGNTNAVSSDGDYLYLANGEDGLCIAGLPAAGAELVPFVKWDDATEINASANFVQAKGDWVFVAKGGGGLKILHKSPVDKYPTVCDYNANGTPKCVQYQEVCSTLYAEMMKVLPESKNQTTLHPEFFTNPNTTVTLTKPATVSVTFIAEGASVKNTLGFYTYEGNNLPAKDNLKRTVIYPNASMLGSGGELVRGNTLTLLGENYPANTTFGFFLFAGGWNGYAITEGFAQQYSINAYNRYGAQQSLVFYNKKCNKLVVTFEDIVVSPTTSDKDYNDAIYTLEISPADAVDYTKYIPIGD